MAVPLPLKPRTPLTPAASDTLDATAAPLIKRSGGVRRLLDVEVTEDEDGLGWLYELLP